MPGSGYGEKTIRNKINRVPHGICLGKQVGKIVHKEYDFAKDMPQRISAKDMTFPSLEMTRKRNIIGKLNLECLMRTET